MIRCFGVDDDLVRLNVYGNNTIQRLDETNYRETVHKKTYADFHKATHLDATVFQYSSSADTTNTVSFISASHLDFNENGMGMTFECEVIAPKNLDGAGAGFFQSDLLTSSVFGLHGAIVNSGSDHNTTANGTDTTWHTGAYSAFQVYLVRDTRYSTNAYFMLTGTEGPNNLWSAMDLPLTSSTIYDIYDNQKWNLAVRIRSSASSWSPTVRTFDAETGPKYEIGF